MSHEHLATYLNDHLAGSVVALELLDLLERTFANQPIARFAANLRAEITADRRELEALMSRLNIAQSRARQAAAWLAEKVTQLKLRLDDRSGGEFRLFEALEAVSLGIEGKRSLWEALGAIARDTPALRIAEYDRLEQRARDQRGQVEAERLKVARSLIA